MKYSLLIDTATQLSDDEAGGHGGHWKAVTDDIEQFLPHFIEKQFPQAGLVDAGPEIMQQLKEIDQTKFPLCLALSYPKESNLGVLTLLKINHVTENGQVSNLLVSMFPYLGDGLEYRAKIKKISIFPNLAEAWLRLELESGFAMTVFDALFCYHREHYRQETSYTFSIAALAHSMQLNQSEDVPVGDHLKSILDMIHKDDDTKYQSPEYISMKQMTGMLSENGDEVLVMGKVVSFQEQYGQIADANLWRVEVEMQPLESDDVPFILPIYIDDSKFEGAWRPELGDYIISSVWMQASLLDR